MILCMQEGRFFHGYYKRYCYLPLFFCGDHLLFARLRSSDRGAAHGPMAAGTEGDS